MIAKTINDQMKNILFLIFTCIILSCNESPETKFVKDGVSLICPQGWIISDLDDLDGTGYYLEIEKEGWNSSGLVIITWVYNYNNDNFNYEEYLNIYKEAFQEQYILDFGDIAFSNYYNNTFNNFSTMSTNYTMSILDVDHEGAIHVFQTGNKNFCIIIQEAIEDKSKNKIGFEIIRNNFKSE